MFAVKVGDKVTARGIRGTMTVMGEVEWTAPRDTFSSNKGMTYILVECMMENGDTYRTVEADLCAVFEPKKAKLTDKEFLAQFSW